MDPVMYILVNTDLKMRHGRIAAQVGHIVQSITEEIVRDSYEAFPIPDHCLTYMKWKKKCTKVVLGATEEELRTLLQHSEARFFVDDIDGRKELTVVGFFPNSFIGSQLECFKLI
jgi:peptidyl-tRNA hydrolase